MSERVVCRIEIIGTETADGGREMQMPIERMVALLRGIDGAWPGVRQRGGWPGVAEFVVDDPAAPKPRPGRTSLCDRLRILRHDRNLSWFSVEDQTGIPERTIIDIEINSVLPTNEQLAALARLYGTTPDALMGEDESSWRPPQSNL